MARELKLALLFQKRIKMNRKKYLFNHLKLLESKLKLNCFKKLNESNNKDKEKYVIINDNQNKNVFAGIPDDVIEYLEKTGDFNMEILDIKNNTITVKDYFELLDTIRCLLSILEYDLLNAYFQKNEN